MKKEIAVILWLWLILSLIFLYSTNHVNIMGTISCGGKGGESSINIDAKSVNIQDSDINSRGGEGGNCSLSLSSDKNQERNYFFSLLSSIIAVMANALFIYDYFTSKKISKNQ